MSPIVFEEAVKQAEAGRIALAGPSGAGKTMSAIALGMHLCAPGKRVYVIDTENRSARKYAGEKCAAAPGGVLSFKVLELAPPFHPDRYIEAQIAAESQPDCGAVVIDSGTHAWSGTGGVLEIKENAARKSRGNDWAAWREATPHHDRLVNSWIRASKHLIVCVRAKTAYDLQENAHGKKEVVKLGMEAQQRAGLEYEFDAFLDVDLKHFATASKSRCPALDLVSFDLVRDMPKLAGALREWLDRGAAAAPTVTATPSAPPVKPAAAPAIVVVAPAASESCTLTPGVDVPSMDPEHASGHAAVAALVRAAVSVNVLEKDKALAPAEAEPKPNSPADLGARAPSKAAENIAAAREILGDAPMTPMDLARAEIVESAKGCKSPADMAKLVLPLINRHKAKFDPAGIEDLRAWYVATAADLKKATQP